MSTLIKEYKYKKNYFEKYEKFFIGNIDKTMKQFELELLVYDEVEYFRPWDHPEFDYPFTPRKTLVEQFKTSLAFDQNKGDY